MCLNESSIYWSKPRLAIVWLISASFLSACSFQPLYGSNPLIHDFLINASIDIESNHDYATQIIRQSFQGFFASQSNQKTKQYRLEIHIKNKTQNLLTTRQGDAPKQRLTTQARFTLYDFQKKRALLKDSAFASLSYHRVPSNEFSRLLSHRDARRRNLDSIALIIRQKLIAFLQED